MNELDKYDDWSMSIKSWKRKHDRGEDDTFDPLPKSSFYAHVIWNKRHIDHRAKKISFILKGVGDLYFYKHNNQTWNYEFRYQTDSGKTEFRTGCVDQEIDCRSFMNWFVDFQNGTRGD